MAQDQLLNETVPQTMHLIIIIVVVVAAAAGAGAAAASEKHFLPLLRLNNLPPCSNQPKA